MQVRVVLEFVSEEAAGAVDLLTSHHGHFLAGQDLGECHTMERLSRSMANGETKGTASAYIPGSDLRFSSCSNDLLDGGSLRTSSYRASDPAPESDLRRPPTVLRLCPQFQTISNHPANAPHPARFGLMLSTSSASGDRYVPTNTHLLGDDRRQTTEEMTLAIDDDGSRREVGHLRVVSSASGSQACPEI